MVCFFPKQPKCISLQLIPSMMSSWHARTILLTEAVASLAAGVLLAYALGAGRPMANFIYCNQDMVSTIRRPALRLDERSIYATPFLPFFQDGFSIDSGSSRRFFGAEVFVGVECAYKSFVFDVAVFVMYPPTA